MPWGKLPPADQVELGETDLGAVDLGYPVEPDLFRAGGWACEWCGHQEEGPAARVHWGVSPWCATLHERFYRATEHAAEPPARIALIGCSSTKASRPSPAKDLYCSTLFTKSLASALADGRFPLILSAKFGLVPFRRVLAPYDQRLPGRLAERGIWSRNVATALRLRFAGIPLDILCLAGADYTAGIEAEAKRIGWTLRRPLAGLGIGGRLRWLTEHGGT